MKNRFKKAFRRTALFATAFALLALMAPTAVAEETPAITPMVQTVQTENPEDVELPDLLNDAEAQNHVPCIQVITYGKNPGTGECKQFPTPCDVPNGWESFGTLEECQAAC